MNFKYKIVNLKLNYGGQSLFEVVIAVVVVSIILIALVNLAVVSVGNTNFSKNNNLATRYTLQASEWLRGERDTAWNNFVAKASSGQWCLTNLSWISGSHAGACGATEYIPNTVFRRNVIFTYNPAVDANTVTVKVVTDWTDGRGSHQVSTSSLLTNWKTR